MSTPNTTSYPPVAIVRPPPLVRSRDQSLATMRSNISLPTMSHLVSSLGQDGPFRSHSPVRNPIIHSGMTMDALQLARLRPSSTLWNMHEKYRSALPETAQAKYLTVVESKDNLRDIARQTLECLDSSNSEPQELVVSSIMLNPEKIDKAKPIKQRLHPTADTAATVVESPAVTGITDVAATAAATTNSHNPRKDDGRARTNCKSGKGGKDRQRGIGNKGTRTPRIYPAGVAKVPTQRRAAAPAGPAGSTGSSPISAYNTRSSVKRRKELSATTAAVATTKESGVQAAQTRNDGGGPGRLTLEPGS